MERGVGREEAESRGENRTGSVSPSESLDRLEGGLGAAVKASNIAQNPRFLSDISTPDMGATAGFETPFSGRAKSALRLKYEAEAEVLRKKIGDLETIRAQLGLSQRAICQLLWVDPSAWTRWAKRGEKAPPHIYRALQWYLALADKYPALDVNFWLATSRQAQDPQAQYEAISKTNREVASLRAEVRKLNLQKDDLSDESTRSTGSAAKASQKLGKSWTKGRMVLAFAVGVLMGAMLVAAVLST